MAFAFGLLVLGAIVIGGIALARRFLGNRDEGADDGGDVLAYLLLALAVGTAGFALASLAATAFPGDDFVVDVRGQVANSLAALVVSVPIAVFLWRRQERRRTHFPASSGWTVYLTLIEAVFMTSLVAALFGLFEWIFADSEGVAWTNIIVFGGIVVFHEWATSRTSPESDARSLPRVAGSAIGLITTLIGLGGLVGWLLSEVYSTLAPTAGGSDLGIWVSFLLAGAPVWWYRWLRPWSSESDTPRSAWLFLVSVAGLTTALAAMATLSILVLTFLFTDTEPAGTYFEAAPLTLSVALVASLAWIHHRHRLGSDRTEPVRAYDYAMTAIGLATTVGGASALSAVALGPADLVGSGSDAVIAVTVALIVGAGVWLAFWTRASNFPRETEASSTPRRVYLIGMSVILGLVSAGALIAVLVIIFQRLLDTGGTESIMIPISLFAFAGLATWHLLRVNAADRELIGSEETLTPFSVTLICSHPGMVSARFPDVARIRVIYRSDDVGVIQDDMADEIVAAVSNQSSIVWVDEDGFRVAPARSAT